MKGNCCNSVVADEGLMKMFYSSLSFTSLGRCNSAAEEKSKIGRLMFQQTWKIRIFFVSEEICLRRDCRSYPGFNLKYITQM